MFHYLQLLPNHHQKIYPLLTLLFLQKNYAQIIFQEKFNTQTLSTYTTLYTSTQYTTLPTGFIDISEGYKNATGSALHPNAPFHTIDLNKKGWGVLYNAQIKDTFLVSTSWVDTNKAISRWVLLPTINGISNNSVLHWQAMAPDPTYADGYAVYISTNTSSTDTSIFTPSTKVFQINDNNTSGGGEKQQWTTHSISLTNYAGQNIRIAFKNISRQKYQLWIDNITIENLPYSYDAMLENNGNTKYTLINQPFTLKARIKNKGYQSFSNILLGYSIQGIASNYQTFALNTPLYPLSSYTVSFTNTISINTPGKYKVKIWIQQVNSQPDQNPFNDTISYDLSVLSTSLTPKILIEHLTDASFPDAPANQDTLRALSQDTSVIITQIHQTDSLKCNLSALHSKYFDIPQNQPIALINRTHLSTENKNYFYRNEWRTKINTLKNTLVPCDIKITNIQADTLTRTITLNVQTTFYTNATGDYRINVYLVENNVYGHPSDTTINGYNQLSSFYFTPNSNYAGQGYFSNTANAFVLNAYQYQHQYVLNQAQKGLYGDASVIPANPTNGNTYIQTYTLSVPPSPNNVSRYHFDNLYIIAFVYEHDTLIENRRLLNVDKKKVTPQPELVTVPNTPSIPPILIYPNPASHFLFISGIKNTWQYGKIIDLTGKEILLIRSEYTDISSLPNGMYYLLIQTNKQILYKKLIIRHE